MTKKQPVSEPSFFEWVREDAIEETNDFKDSVRRAVTVLPPNTSLRQFLIFLEFASADLSKKPISLAELKDKHDLEDQKGQRVFAKTTSAAFASLFDELGLLDKEVSESDSRIKKVRLTPAGRAAIFKITNRPDY